MAASCSSLADTGRSCTHAMRAGQKRRWPGSPVQTSVVIGDLSSIAETKHVAEQVNALGLFDAVIHNAGMGYREQGRTLSVDGVPQVFAVNSLAPYILTCLISRPKRLVFVSSGLHTSGDASIEDLLWERRAWNGMSAYADTKLHNVILAFAVPAGGRGFSPMPWNRAGWPRKWGDAEHLTASRRGRKRRCGSRRAMKPEAMVTGKYFYHKKLQRHNPAADDIGDTGTVHC